MGMTFRPTLPDPFIPEVEMLRLKVAALEAELTRERARWMDEHIQVRALTPLAAEGKRARFVRHAKESEDYIPWASYHGVPRIPLIREIRNVFDVSLFDAKEIVLHAIDRGWLTGA